MRNIIKFALLTVLVLPIALASTTGCGGGSGYYYSYDCYCQWEWDCCGNLVYVCYYCKDGYMPEMPTPPDGFMVMEKNGQWIAVLEEIW